MKPVNREQQLRAEAQNPKIKVARPKSGKPVTKSQPKTNKPKIKADNIFRPSKNEHNYHKNKKRGVAGIPPRYKAAGAGLAGLALVGVGVAAVSGHNNQQSIQRDDTTSSQQDDSDNSSLDFGGSNKKSHKKSNSTHKSKKSKEKMNLNDLLNDTKDSKDKTGKSSSSSNSVIDDLLRATGADTGSSSVDKLLADADKSQSLANALGNEDNKNSSNSNSGVQNINAGLMQLVGSETAATASQASPQPIANAASATATTSMAASAATPASTTPVTPVTPSSSAAVPASSATTPVTPVTPVNPGSSATPVTPGSSSTPVTPDNPGSSSTPVTPDNPGSSTTPISDNPASDNPGSSATPGSSSTPASDTPASTQPITSDTTVTTQATTGVTSGQADSANRVPIAENVHVSMPGSSVQPTQPTNSGVGIPQAGDYVVTGTVTTTDGHTVTINKNIHVENGATLQDNSSSTTVTQTATANPATVKVGETVSLFDSMTAKTADGQELSGLGNGGISFDTPGNYQITYQLGNVEVTKNVTVLASA